MSHRRTKTLLPIAAALLLLNACHRTTGTDSPLPTQYYPSIIVNSDNQILYAVDPNTGKKNWEYGLPPFTGVTPPMLVAPSPLVYNNMLYVATFNSDTIYKFVSKTGTLVKKIKLTAAPAPGGEVHATPVASGDLLFVAVYSDNTIYALDTGTLAIRWQVTADGPLVSSPTVYNDHLYFASIVGTVFALNKSDGTTYWTRTCTTQPDPSDPSVTSIASFYSSPAIADPYLYIGGANDSTMFCIYLNSTTGTGIERWQYKTKGGIYSSPTAYAGTCIFGCNDFKVYCIDTSIYPWPGPLYKTVPDTRWIYTTNGEIISSPTVSNQVVYAASKDYRLYALNILDGKKKWSFATTGLVKASPVPYRGLVYIGSYDKMLYAVDSALGTLRWQYSVDGQMSSSPTIDDLTGRSFNSQISGLVN